jgi:uncharacterized alkaline shock family protein YloU
MNFLTRIAVLLYVTMILFISLFMLLYVFNYIDARPVMEIGSLIYRDDTLRLAFGSVGGALLLLNYLFYQIFTVSAYKSHSIAFDNPTGRVSVSLMAIEDLIQRVISQTQEVKKVKSKISASKKGMQVKIKLVLRSEGRIPEVTSRIQEMVKRKVQEAIGLDEPIDVSIYVGQILPDQGREKYSAKGQEQPKEPEQTVPFQGYRA